MTFSIRDHVIIALLTILVIVLSKVSVSDAQPRVTNTPIPVVIPSAAPTQTPRDPNNLPLEVSPSPTVTPTQPLPNAFAIPVASSGSALIRDFPESGEVIGILVSDTSYQILGRYISWYQIRLDNDPNRPAWVYYQDIQINGNVQDIPDINPEDQPANRSPQENASATAAAFLQTPGVIETLTAEARFIEIESTDSASSNTVNGRPPTYTPPAEIIRLQPTVAEETRLSDSSDQTLIQASLDNIAQGNIPPIAPILALTLIGTLGIIISLIRR